MCKNKTPQENGKIVHSIGRYMQECDFFKIDSNTSFIQATVCENAINLYETMTNKCTMSRSMGKRSPYVGAS